MQHLHLSKKLKLCAIAVGLTIGLSACNSNTSPQGLSGANTNQAFSALDKNQAQYQELLANADENSRFPAMILLARSSIVARDFGTAANLIADMKKEAITPLQQDQTRIIEASLFMNKGQNTDALFALNKVNVVQLPNSVASFYYQLSSSVELKLYQESKNKEHLIKSCNDKIALLNYVNPTAKQTVALQIVDQLKSLPASELTILLNKTTDQIFQGFIAFALLDSSQSETVKKQLTKDWLDQYESHPLNFAAQQVLNGSQVNNNQPVDPEFATSTAVSLKEGDKLAVLLPLTGRFAASVGEPARLGILAALQDRNSKLKVTFYDTNRMTMEEIISALKQNGTNFIIGPILKPEVDSLIATNIDLPAIVFNQPGNAKTGLYYYNLGPDYEGALAASKVYADGKTRPVVIAPESTRGQRAVSGFINTWEKTGAKSPIICRFTDLNTVNTALTTCPLNVADAFYVNATATEVIKVRENLPDQIPLYLTDRSFMGLNHSSGEAALSGAYLGDMPWLLTDSSLKQDLMASLPKADSQIQRIFASAYDSINLAFNLTRLSQDKNDVLHGISGDLQISNNGLIEMAPMWVKLGLNRPVN